MPDQDTYIYNIQIRLGNKKITLYGAESFEVTEGSKPPKLTTRAPVGGKRVFQQIREGVNILVHRLPPGGNDADSVVPNEEGRFLEAKNL